jgi:hypothetical protein
VSSRTDGVVTQTDCQGQWWTLLESQGTSFCVQVSSIQRCALLSVGGEILINYIYIKFMTDQIILVVDWYKINNLSKRWYRSIRWYGFIWICATFKTSRFLVLHEEVWVCASAGNCLFSIQNGSWVLSWKKICDRDEALWNKISKYRAAFGHYETASWYAKQILKEIKRIIFHKTAGVILLRRSCTF